MIIHDYKLIELFNSTDGALAMQSYWVLNKAIVPYINNGTLTAFPSVATICKKSGLSKPTVLKALEYLEEKKIIKIERRYDPLKNQHKSNVYSIETDLLKTVGNLKSKPTEELVGGSQRDLLGVVNEIDKGSQRDLLGVVNEIDTNLQENINLQENLTRESGKPQLTPSQNRNLLIEEIKANPMYEMALDSGISKGYTEQEIWKELQPLLIIYINEKSRVNSFSKFNYWIKDLKPINQKKHSSLETNKPKQSSVNNYDIRNEATCPY
jgi:hypothetical protein